MNLSAALDALERAGAAAGLDGAAARDEGARLSAAVAESITGAPAAWLAAVGSPDASFGAFFEAAASARRWRTSPTDLLDGHRRDAGRDGVLGRPRRRRLGRLRARPRRHRRHRPRLGHGRGAAVGRLRAPPPARGRSAGSGPTAVPARRPPHRPRPPDAPGAHARGAAGRAGRARRARRGQGADPPADAAPARGAPAHGGRPHDADAHPPPGVPREPRDRQDDGRAAGVRHLPRARAADQGAPGRGRPLRARRRLPRADGGEDVRGRGHGARRRPVHRRGVRPGRGPVRRRGGEHAGQGHGGPPRRPRRDRRRLPAVRWRRSWRPTPGSRAGSPRRSSSPTTPTPSCARSSSGPHARPTSSRRPRPSRGSRRSPRCRSATRGSATAATCATCWTRRSPGTRGASGTLSIRAWTSCGCCCPEDLVTDAATTSPPQPADRSHAADEPTHIEEPA